MREEVKKKQQFRTVPANSNQNWYLPNMLRAFTVILPSVARTLDNASLLLTRSEFLYPSGHFLLNFTLDNSNLVRSFIHSFFHSFVHSLVRFFVGSVCLSVLPYVCSSVSGSVGRSAGQSTSRSVGRSVILSVIQSVSQLSIQSASTPASQSVS